MCPIIVVARKTAEAEARRIAKEKEDEERRINNQKSKGKKRANNYQTPKPFGKKRSDDDDDENDKGFWHDNNYDYPFDNVADYNITGEGRID